MLKSIVSKILLYLGVLTILGNLVFLDWQLFQEKKTLREEKEISTVSLPTPTLRPVFKLEESSPSGQKIEGSGEEDCPQACLLEIDKAISTATPMPPPTPVSSVGSAVKIFYLPLGSGSTTSRDWTDLPGLSSYIDPANYGKIKTVIFEASLRIPTANGRIYARLYNRNDGRPVWFSEISAEGAASTLIQSAPITFEAGNKLYQVQAKTTMGFESFVDFARVKFIVE